LVTLLPVIGLIQVGTQSRADRYTYVPLTGVFVAVAWWVPKLLEGWHYRKVTLWSASLGIIVMFVIITNRQIGYWKDGESLWQHALAVTRNSSTAHCNYARALERRGLRAEAMQHYQEALRI